MISDTITINSDLLLHPTSAKQQIVILYPATCYDFLSELSAR